MKTYSELSDGKWIITDDETVDENGEFILIPHVKGIYSPAQPPILVCDSTAVISTWNGKGFLVTLPKESSTYNFTLTWGNLTRTFQFIVSDHLLEDMDSLKISLSDANGKISQLEKDISDTISSTNTKIDAFIQSFNTTNNSIRDTLINQYTSLVANANESRIVKQILEEAKSSIEDLRDSRIASAADLRKTAQQWANTTSVGEMGMHQQYTTAATNYESEAVMYDWILDSFISRGLNAASALFEGLNTSLNSNNLILTSQKLDGLSPEISRIKIQENSSQVNQPASVVNDFELEMLAMEIMGYPWRIFNMVRNEPGTPYEGSGLWTSRTLMGPDNNIVFTEVFEEKQINVNIQPPLPFDVLFTSKMFSVGDKYMIARSVKNNGMPQVLADRILPPNSTVFSFYTESGEAGDILKYYDRIFLNDEIKGVITGLQVGESIPYAYRQMPSTWDNFPGVSDPGNVKINIRRDGENAYRVYYCDDNVDVNLGDLCIFPSIDNL